MDLDRLWNWDSRKLACRIRVETCNPQCDELRERFSELAGIDYRELVNDMKNSKKKKDLLKLSVDGEADKTFKDLLNRSHVLGAASQSLLKLKEQQDSQKITIAKKNIHKQYSVVPKSPPRRVMMDIQRVRAKPILKIPDQDEDFEGNGSMRVDKKASNRKGMTSIYRSAIDDALQEENEEKERNQETLMGKVFPTYNGDMFGSGGPYLDSMIYLSRMADAQTKSTRRNSLVDVDDLSLRGSVTNNQTPTADLIRSAEEKKTSEQDNKDENEHEHDTSVYDAKLYCAASLCNWSRDPSNANRLASEGAVRAILQLLLEPHYKILKYCAAAFRYMSEHLPLALAMIEENVTNTIADTILSASDDFITYNMAIALVNLTRVSGKEVQLVDAAAVLALQNLIVVQPDLSGACARGLYNLTCVDNQYNYIERVIRALVALSSSTLANVKHICAAALCNLSDLRSVRPRLVEEGVISVVGQLSRGAETRTRRICAVILQNLSASKLCRVDMTSKNSVSVAYSLSADQDPIILRAVSLTLSRLATEAVNCNRIIHESGITALCNIGVKYPTIPGISQPVAIAFQLLSSRPNARLTIVQEGSITAIASLLRISNDMVTIQHSLLALCYLLLEPESHLPIVQQGLVITLMNLMSMHASNEDNLNDTNAATSNDIIKDICSLAFFNLSGQKDSRKHIVNAGAVISITALSRNSKVITRRRCAATLCNISYYEQGFNRMVTDGVIQCLVGLLLSPDIETIHYTCAAICRLCNTEENGRLVYESGAIPNLVKGACEGDVTTKQFCGAVLSALSFYEICRQPLIDNGIMKVLATLSALKDDISKQRCLIAYANLSCEESVQEQMVEEGVVKIISSLADSYQEANYLCCAKAMCNLSCNPNLSSRLANDGGIYALLMICMVHSVDKFTKLLCVQTFLNIFDENTVEIMLKEGIIGAIGNLSKVNDEKIVYLCALLFNQLTKHRIAKFKIVEKPSHLLSLFNIYHSFEHLTSQTIIGVSSLSTLGSSLDPEGSNTIPPLGPISTYTSKLHLLDDVDYIMHTKVLVARTCCNLILSNDNQVCAKTMESGVIRVIEKAAIELMDDSQETLSQILLALFSATIEMKYTALLSSSHLLLTLLQVAKKLTSNADGVLENYLTICKVIALIGWDTQQEHQSMKAHTLSLHYEEVTTNMIELIRTNFRVEAVSWIAMILRYIVTNHPHPVSMIRRGLIQGLLNMDDQVAKVDIPEDYVENIVLAIRILVQNQDSECLRALCNVSIVSMLRRAVSKHLNNQTCYHLSVIMYYFSTLSTEIKQDITNTELVELISITSRYPMTFEPYAAALLSFVFDTKCRSTFISEDIAELLGKILASKSNEGTLNNAISACFALSKVPRCRELMTSSSISLDTYLIAISNKSESSKLRHNCARVLKNFALDSSEAIEEGAVAALIALSLDGRPKSRIGFDVTPPEIVPISFIKGKPPSCIDDTVYEGEWYETYTCKKGGASSKGPEPPSPPPMIMDGVSQYPSMDEAEVNQDVETKSKMAFAKMQVPLEMRSSYVLSEEELTIKLTDLENDDEESMSSESNTVIVVRNSHSSGSMSESEKEKIAEPNLNRRSSLTKAGNDIDSSSRSMIKNLRKSSSTQLGNRTSPQNVSMKMSKRVSSQRLQVNDSDGKDDDVASSLKKVKSTNKPANKAAQLGLYA